MRRYARQAGDSEAETRVVAIQFDNPARVGFAQRRTTAQIAQRADLAQDCERLAYADPVRVDVSPIRRCEIVGQVRWGRREPIRQVLSLQRPISEPGPEGTP